MHFNTLYYKDTLKKTLRRLKNNDLLFRWPAMGKTEAIVLMACDAKVAAQSAVAYAKQGSQPRAIPKAVAACPARADR